jgi:hypothetical protein
MKKTYVIAFIVAFLCILYAVPLVQTAYEFKTNPGHRIQMLDLVEDIFVSPAKKMRADRALLDSLTMLPRLMANALNAAAGDTARSFDPRGALDLCEEAAFKATLLKKSAVDYNRHLQAGKNIFAGRDTATPYYLSLVNLAADLASAQATIASAQDRAAIDRFIETLGPDISKVKVCFGNGNGFSGYLTRTLTALRRTMVGADYLRPYEKEMEKSSIFANAIRPWMLMGYYAAFHDLGGKGVMGKRGWLFYRPDVDYLVRPDIYDARSKIVDPNDAPMNDDAVKSIVSFKKQLAAQGVDLLFVIMPTKPSIYPDLLSEQMNRAAAGTFSHSLRLMEKLKAAGVETIDLFTPFAKERASDTLAGDSLYLRTDTHFKTRAVRLTAAVVAERVRRYPWFTQGTAEYALDSLVVPRKGDIGEMVGLPQSVMRSARPPFPAEATKCYQVYRLARDGSGAVTGRTLYKDDFKRSEILVLGDSFSRIFQTDEPRAAGWIAHLALELAQPVASIVNDGGASTLVRQSLARKPNLLKGKKLVVWEVVERDFRFGDEGWKDVPITFNNN